MKERTFAVVTLAAALMLAAQIPSAEANKQVAPPINWNQDLHQAHARSVSTDKPMLLVFGADWCHYCHKLHSNTLSHPGMAAYINKNFVPVYLDADRDKKVAEILGIKPLPCTVVLSPEVDLLGKIVGYHEVRQYYGALNESREMQTRIRQAKYSAETPQRR